MRPARIILLLVAVIAGGLAFYLVTGSPAPQPDQTTEVVQMAPAVATTEILVASTAVGLGERLNPDNVQWQEWPESALRPEYVTISAMPDAREQLDGAVVRFEFFPGEPIREAKLVRADQGYLSAVLAPGKRGVSVAVTPVSSAGGFVVPNDHVDVLLTTNTPNGQRSELILPDVRVLAIGARLGEMGASGGNIEGDGSSPTPVVFDAGTIATLELDPGQAETLINAATRGELSLTLRSVADFNRVDAGGSMQPTNQEVRLIRYGREQSVVTGASASPAPTAPAMAPASAALPQIQTGPQAPQVLAQ